VRSGSSSTINILFIFGGKILPNSQSQGIILWYFASYNKSNGGISIPSLNCVIQWQLFKLDLIIHKSTVICQAWSAYNFIYYDHRKTRNIRSIDNKIWEYNSIADVYLISIQCYFVWIIGKLKLNIDPSLSGLFSAHILPPWAKKTMINLFYNLGLKCLMYYSARIFIGISYYVINLLL
jgi:hypothetical protein